jgi:hypothetical protein
MVDINSVGNISASLGQAATGDAVAITVMKKALAIQAQSALQLIQALPQPAAVSPSGSGGSVGSNVNIFA